MSNGMTLDQARRRLNIAIVLPIVGLVIAAIVGISLAPVFTRPPQGFDWLGFSLIIIAAIAAAANLIAQWLTAGASAFTSEKTGQPLKAVRGANGTVLGFHIEWIALNLIFLLILTVRLAVPTLEGLTDFTSKNSEALIAIVFAVMIGAVNVIYIILRSKTRTTAG